jgi:phosphatidylglycerophosphatase A
MNSLAMAIATCLGVGYVPVAPGTFGTAAGFIVWWLLPQTLVAQLLGIVVVFVAGSWSATIAERRLGGTDPGPVVVDEVVGTLITMAGVGSSWMAIIAGFFLFRLFDIVKPYPANRFERLHGGVGIMADDAMAAVYANIALRLVLLLTRDVSIGLG